jgi:hypothetical protein
MTSELDLGAIGLDGPGAGGMLGGNRVHNWQSGPGLSGGILVRRDHRCHGGEAKILGAAPVKGLAGNR